MKNIYLLFSIIALPLFTFAQPDNPACDGNRYLNQVFANVTATNGVQFGSNTTYCGTPKNLLMDIYEPTGDTAQARPVIFIGFGGSFIGGARADVAPVCQEFARRGFVSVAFDYRLFELCGFPDSTTMLDVVVKAVSDLKAGIRFMRQNAATYRIDTNYTFVGGISAGAILALHTAYLDPSDNPPAYIMNAINNNGGWEGNSNPNNLQYSSSIQGVMSLSGGLHRTAWINQGDMPLFAIHETGDGTVPYGYGYAQVGGINLITLSGGSLLHQRADYVGIPNTFISVVANAHVGYINNAATMTNVYQSTSGLFHDYVLCSNLVSVPDIAPLDFNAYPNPSAGDLIIEVNAPGNGSYTVEVSDQLGRVTDRYTNINQPAFIFSKGTLPAGMYNVTVRFEDGQTAPMTKKIIFN